MKQLLLSIFLIFSIGFLQANDKKIMSKKIVISSDQGEKNVDVKVNVDDDIMKLIINKDDDEKVYEINLKDKGAFKALEEELENLDIDVNILDLKGDDDDHQLMVYSHNDFDTDFNHDDGGYLGVKIQDITDQLRDYFKIKGDGGVLVTEVLKDSPAEKAGIVAGDIITNVNDVRIGDSKELSGTIRNEEPEAEASIVVVRNGREKLIKVTLGSNDDTGFWFGNMGGHHSKGMKTKYKHNCNDPSPGCRLKDGYSFNFDGVIPGGSPNLKKHKVIIRKQVQDEKYDSLKKEIDELRKEIQKLKE